MSFSPPMEAVRRSSIVALSLLGLIASTFFWHFVFTYSIPKELEFQRQNTADFLYAQLNQQEQ